jgi:hypothetical protein
MSTKIWRAKSSLYQNNFIYRPLIDEWAYLIVQKKRELKLLPQFWSET